MPEPTPAPGRPDRQPDYFDRLLARHTAIGNAGTGVDAGQTRPRLPGPFERSEARWHEAVQQEEPTSLVSPPVLYPTREPSGQLRAGQIRVERRTEIRTGPPASVPHPAPSAPASSRWITRPTPVERPTAWSRPDEAPVHRATSEPSASPGAVRPANAKPTTGRGAAPTSPAPAVRAVPQGDRSATARRGTAQPPVPRRRIRSAEPAVHIRIGRLEVRAGADRTPIAPTRAGRPAPAVSLSDYLSAPGAANGEGRP